MPLKNVMYMNNLLYNCKSLELLIGISELTIFISLLFALTSVKTTLESSITSPKDALKDIFLIVLR